ncbi:MAG: TSUP family transporter [Actinomycetota bacterium]
MTTPSATSPVRTPIVPLIAVGAVGGAFSALFGVGGGVVMVPLLIMLCGYGSRAATATSLAAIAVIALVGTATHGVLGNVDWLAALLVGIPALLGVTLGVKLRTRISAVTISRGFAVLLVIAAVLLALDP